MSLNRDQEDCAEEFSAQIHLLRKCAHEFDSGDAHEFRNIARALRVIIAKDDRGNGSLIELAGLTMTPMRDTRTLDHDLNLIPSFALAGIVFGPQTIGCRALLGNAPDKRVTSFSEWLQQPVINDKKGEIFNRLRLVKAVANLGGATHFPPDVREYFRKLQGLGVTAGPENKEIKYADVEKHSIRQIAHEVLTSFDPTYSRDGQFEVGAFMISAFELILYPGRTVRVEAGIKVKPFPAIINRQPSHGQESIGVPAIDLPYEQTAKNAPCPCRSGLRFKACCSEARQFDAEFIEAFEKRHRLGEYRDSKLDLSHG